MPVVELQDIPDYVAGTLRELGRQKIQQIAQQRQSYITMQHWFKKDKVTFDTGSGIQRNLMNALSRQARHVGVTHVVTVDIPTLIDTLTLNWRHAYVPWGFTYHEVITNSGDALVFKVLKPRRLDAWLSLAEELEAKAWAVPGATNKTDPMGIPYWVVYNATTGFNGGLPSGHTTVGGVDLTDTPNFKNYTAQYTSVTKADLIKKMRTGHRKIQWATPISNQDYRKSEFADLRIYTDEARIADFEDIGEAQNENLGRDLAPYSNKSSDVKSQDGVLLFRKNPIVWVPYLDDTAAFSSPTAPVYMIDHSTFYPVCLSGDFFRECKPRSLENQPNMFRVDTWLTYNYLCLDRRRNAVFATG